MEEPATGTVGISVAVAIQDDNSEMAVLRKEVVPMLEVLRGNFFFMSCVDFLRAITVRENCAIP